MSRSKNKGRQKKRISKHVLAAKERRIKEAETRETTTLAKGEDGITVTHPKSSISLAKKKNNPIKKHEKDPSEGHTYLSLWKKRHLGTEIWKFNKNTQSWLLRHMYDANKVKKETFTLLIDYILQTPNDGVGFKDRIYDDAQRRVIRYVEWEPLHTKQQLQQEKEEGESTKEIIPATETSSSLSNTNMTKEKNSKVQNANKKEEDKYMDEKRRWTELNAHDKRKEYKRARKLMEALSSQENN